MAWLWLGIIVALLALFGIAEAAGVGLLTDPGRTLGSLSRPAAAAVSVGLLAADIVLPVPSSVLMVALGALYGVALGGALGAVGGVAAAVAGGLLGRQGRGSLARLAGADRVRIEAMLERYGVALVIVSRPVPLLAESVALVAGATGMSLFRIGVAALAGDVPVALAYAYSGARGRQADGVGVFAVLVGLSLAALTVSVLRSRRAAVRPGGAAG